MRTLIEVDRYIHGHDHTAINRHSTRRYEDEQGCLYILSCTLDGCPPFFEACGPYGRDHEGHLPRLKVNGQEYWGSGISWGCAENRFCTELDAVIVQPVT